MVNLIAFDTDKAQQAVQELSKLLRYVLYDNQQTYVPLGKETDFIRNYIELMRIRLSSNVQMTTQIDILPDSRTLIAPLIFISLIENAFKHGISPTERSFIHIHLAENETEVICEISNSFERSFPQSPKVLVDGKWVDDYVDEDTQLCYRHSNGEECSVVAACAHYGICNIMEYAKKLTGAKHVHTYLGGSHLRSDEVPQRQMDFTCDYVRREKIKRFYICHDTDLPCVIQLANACPAMEAGVGLVVECE